MTKASVHGVLMTGAVAVAIGLSTAPPSDGRPGDGSAGAAVFAVAAPGAAAAGLGAISGIVRFESEFPKRKRVRVSTDMRIVLTTASATITSVMKWNT